MLRAWVGPLIVVALFLAVLPAADAQTDQKFFTIQTDLKPGPSQTITKDLGSVEFYVNVTIQQLQQQNPLASQFNILLEASLDPAPNGFTFQLGGPPECRENRCAVNVDPGTTTRFIVGVRNTITDPDVTDAKFRLNLKSTPQFDGGQTNPITAPVVNTMRQEDTETVEGAAKLDLSTSEKLYSFAKHNPWWLVLGGGAILGVAVVLVRKRKGGLGVATDSPVQEVLPGRGASFPVQVTNEGGQRASVSLTTSEVPGGWSAILPVDKIELGPNETTTIWLTLKAPGSAHAGEHVQLNFVASSQDGTTGEVLVEAVVVERYGVRGGMVAPHGPSDPAPEPAPMPQAPMEEASVAVARVAPKRRRH